MAIERNILLKAKSGVSIDLDFVHKFRNFCEEVWQRIEDTELGDVGGLEAVDKVESTLNIHIKNAKNVLRCRKLVSQLTAEHFLDEALTTKYY